MNSPKLSFEFFPPRNEAQKRRFWHTLGCLETLNPEWVSVTWGALGADNQPSLDILRELDSESTLPVAAHLTCYGCTKANLLRRLTALQSMGINHVVALRGDKPDDSDLSRKSQNSASCLPVDSGLKSKPVETLQYAEELVSLINQASGMDISVAAYPESHPESKDQEADLLNLKHKLDAGASRALTQFFFKAETFLTWRDKAVSMGIDKPLVPGILPIHDIDRVQVFARKCGTHVPAWLVSKYEKCGTSKSARRALSLDLATELCETLRSEGVDDFHIYTLNQSGLAYALGKRLSSKVSESVAA